MCDGGEAPRGDRRGREEADSVVARRLAHGWWRTEPLFDRRDHCFGKSDMCIQARRRASNRMSRTQVPTLTLGHFSPLRPVLVPRRVLMLSTCLDWRRLFTSIPAASADPCGGELAPIQGTDRGRASMEIDTRSPLNIVGTTYSIGRSLKKKTCDSASTILH